MGVDAGADRGVADDLKERDAGRARVAGVWQAKSYMYPTI
jgi:hypothetical protein